MVLEGGCVFHASQSLSQNSFHHDDSRGIYVVDAVQVQVLVLCLGHSERLADASGRMTELWAAIEESRLHQWFSKRPLTRCISDMVQGGIYFNVEVFLG